MDLDPLPPEMEPPGAGAGMRRSDGPSSDKSDSFKAHRDVFFFTLQRELEKVSLMARPCDHVRC
jgi:CDK inhibitor PHO81